MPKGRDKSELRHMNIRNTMKKNPDIPVRTARERTPDTERLVVWQKRSERKASVFFPKYGLYKHYDIKDSTNNHFKAVKV